MKTTILWPLVLCCVFSAAAWGQAMPDPTRPPPGIGDATQTLGLMTYPQVRGLQSVIISPDHCAAIIDGKTVELGARHGSERLVEVTARGVVMQGEHGNRALALFPAVGMKMTKTPSGEPAIKCKLGQSRPVKRPLKQAVQEEMK